MIYTENEVVFAVLAIWAIDLASLRKAPVYKDRPPLARAIAYKLSLI